MKTCIVAYLCCATRSYHAQAQRLAGLLEGYGLSVPKPAPYSPGMLTQAPDGQVRVVIGTLEDGFVLPGDALVCVTDEEIFGQRRQQRRAHRQRKHHRPSNFSSAL